MRKKKVKQGHPACWPLRKPHCSASTLREGEGRGRRHAIFCKLTSLRFTSASVSTSSSFAGLPRFFFLFFLGRHPLFLPFWFCILCARAQSLPASSPASRLPFPPGPDSGLNTETSLDDVSTTARRPAAPASGWFPAAPRTPPSARIRRRSVLVPLRAGPCIAVAASMGGSQGARPPGEGTGYMPITRS